MVASLPELPHESLFQILEKLDNQTVCALGATCKALNNVVFPWFFYEHTSKRVLDNWVGWDHRTPSYMLRAIRYSFGSGNLGGLSYKFFFENGDSNLRWRRLLEDVEDFRAIIGEAKKMKELTLSLTQLDVWARSSVAGRSIPADMKLEVWKQSFVSLLNAVAQHGHGKLSITDGGIFTKLLEGAGDSLGKATASGRPRVPFVQHMLHLFKGRTKKTIEYSEPEGASSGFQNIVLLSDMPFTSTFLDHTIELFHQSANTLTNLELKLLDTPSWAWHKVARELHLPHLTLFKMSCPVSVGSDDIRALHIVLFLSAHPSIERLHLHGVEAPAQLSRFPKSKDLILPNLTFLLAHPFYVQWILRKRNPRPNLKFITLLTENHVPRPHVPSTIFDHDLLDDALQAIRYCQPSDSTIGYRFTTEEGLNDWLQRHVDLQSQFVGPWRRLRIQFALPVSVHAGRFDLFVRWVALFVNVEYLDMEEQVIVWRGSRLLSSLQTLHATAPQLKVVQFSAGNRPICIRSSVESNEVVYFKEV